MYEPLNYLIKDFINARALTPYNQWRTSKIMKRKLLNIKSHINQCRKFEPSSIYSNVDAMYTFIHLWAMKKEGEQDAAEYLFYFATLVANCKYVSQEDRKEASKWLTFVLFGITQWGNYVQRALYDPNIEYKGKLNIVSFYDILLLELVYKAWDTDPWSELLQHLKTKAPQVANNHRQYSKEDVMIEGKLAHQALFKVIEEEITIREESK